MSAGAGRRIGAGAGDAALSTVRDRFERSSRGVAPPPRADEPRSDEPAAADGARPQPRSEAEFAAAMGEAFASDRPGNAGSATTLAAVSAAFHGPRTAGALLRAADCRATRCRLTVEFDDAAANNRVVAEMFTALAENGADVADLGIAIPTRDLRADGRIDATVYLFRGEPTLR